MLYKYVFVPGVNSNIFILISFLILCDILYKWGYCISTYNQVIPHLHLPIIAPTTSDSSSDSKSLQSSQHPPP